MKNFLKSIVVWILTWEAQLVLAKYHPRIIAVTGSVGKTSTKDAIYTLLAPDAFVRKSEKSFNSEIGVPLTILGVPTGWLNPFVWLSNIFSGVLLLVRKHSYPEWLILEVGADRPGDIEKISRWLAPDIVVVTRFAPVPVHVEFFKSPEEVIREKSWLVRALKEGGTLVLSADDRRVLALKDLVRRKVVTFGFGRNGEVEAVHEAVAYERKKEKLPFGMRFDLKVGKERARVELRGSVGRQLIYAALAASAVGVSIGLSGKTIADRLTSVEGPNGRMKILEGKKGAVILDDSYNSSPVAVREALDALALLRTAGRKIAVLGDMLELGRFSVSEHKAIGAYAAVRADVLVVIGVRARDASVGALEAFMDKTKIFQFDEATQAGKELQGLISSGDVVLVKGSQGMRMERIVEALMAHPENKENLLVRQEEEWTTR